MSSWWWICYLVSIPFKGVSLSNTDIAVVLLTFFMGKCTWHDGLGPYCDCNLYGMINFHSACLLHDWIKIETKAWVQFDYVNNWHTYNFKQRTVVVIDIWKFSVCSLFDGWILLVGAEELWFSLFWFQLNFSQNEYELYVALI
mgnify:CR=1 FL=1